MMRILGILLSVVASTTSTGCGLIPPTWFRPAEQQQQEYAVMKPLAVGAATIPPELLGRIRNRKALIIGISTYRWASVGGIQDLRYAAKDADAFRVHLLNSGFDTVRVQTDTGATLETIRIALRELVASSDTDDFVIISWAGHCVADPGSGQLFLLAHDSRLDRLQQSALPLAEFQASIASSRSERLLLVVDTCHAGAVVGEQASSAERRDGDILAAMRGVYVNTLPENAASDRPTPVALTSEWVRSRNIKMRMVFASSQCGEPSMESEELKHGMFSYFLLKGLQGDADSDGDGVVTVSEVVKYTGAMVRSATANRQNPAICGTFDGTVPVGQSRGTSK
jgi:uncharacterized caspase-like protein